MIKTFYRKNLHSFITSCFVNEAKRENVDVYLDYIPKQVLGSFKDFDIYLPDGLSFLGKQYEKPFYVEIKAVLNSSVLSTLEEIIKNETSDFKGTVFIITDTSETSIERLLRIYEINTKKVVFLGAEIVDKLKERNRTTYLNYLFGTGEVVIGKDNDLNLYPKQGFTVLGQKKTSLKPIVEIEKNDSEKIFIENENAFKAYIHNDTEYSKCAIIIGNGVSIPFGSDSWNSMIKNMLDRLKPFHIEDIDDVDKFLSKSSYALSSFVKSTLIREENEDAYYDAIRYCIYRKYNSEIMHKQKSLVKVIALAKEKIPQMPILTYNYDTFVEKQFSLETKKDLHYYWEQRLYDEEKMKSIYKDNVIHLHGYISYETKDRNGIILTDDDYYGAYLRNNWTKNIQIDVLKKYKCLFVGSSMSDLFQMSVIQEARKREEKWDCFALVCMNSLQFKEKMQIIQYYKEKGIRLISADNFDKLPVKLADLFGLPVFKK